MFKKLYTLGLFALGLTALNAQDVELTRVGGYATGVFDEGACEIVSYSASTGQLYYVNAEAGTVGILGIANPTSPTEVSTVNVLVSSASQGFVPGGINAVAVGPDYFVVAVENDDKQMNGVLAFYQLDGTFITTIPAGALPDNVQVSPNGEYVVSANEGEPDDDYMVDPLGSITIVDVSGGVDAIAANNAMTVDFTEWNGTTFTDGTRIFGQKNVDLGGGQYETVASTVAEDLEPEYVAFNQDQTKAFVTCQENNTVITIDLASGNLDAINGLGYKDHSLSGNGIDPSDKADDITIQTAPVYGMFQPDAMVSYTVDGVEYLFTANEGDARDYEGGFTGYSEEDRLKDLTLDATVFPNAADMQLENNLGRLKVTTSQGDTDGDGDYDEVYIYGARSFSIWDVSDMSLTYDSGDDFEQQLLIADPVNFNSTNDEHDTRKNRSDDKGCEPEAIDVGTIGDNVYAFIGLERMGGIMVYDVTDVNAVEFKTYNNYRNFDVDATSPDAGDLAPECVKFISADNHPGGNDLLVVSNEVSGTISIYTVDVEEEDDTMDEVENVELERLGGFSTNVFDEGAAEIVDYSSDEEALYYVNADAGTVGILDITDPTLPVEIETVSVADSVDANTNGFVTGGINACSVGPDYFVVAVENDDKQADGVIAFFNLDGTFITTVPAGALPDNIQVSANGDYVVSANEGEPDDDYLVDPLGSITIVDVSGGAASVSASNANTYDFSAWNGTTFTDGTRIFGEQGGTPSTVAEDLEPEYVAFNEDQTKAFVVCQENNAVITINLADGNLDAINGLGYKDHSVAGNGIDPSDKADDITIQTAPVFGMYQPDAMVSYTVDGVEYLFTANEGDARDYDGYSEEDRLKDLTLDATAFPNAATIQDENSLGRLKVTTSQGDTDGDGDFDEVYIYGARSFSMWKTSDMSLAFDSGDDFEQQLLIADPVNFNSTNDDNDSFKNRSDDKGCEPEAIDVGTINGHTYAFIGLERMGGVMVYDVTDVNDVQFETYYNNRNFDYDATSPLAGDLAPECVKFISADDHSGDQDLLVVSNEVSGTISIYAIYAPEADGNNGGGTSINETESDELVIFPNPTNGADLNISKVGDYAVMNTVGQVVASYNNVNMIPTSTLSNGTYFLVDINNNERAAFTVMQ